MPYRQTLGHAGGEAARAKAERGDSQAARDLEGRITTLIPLAQTSGFGFLAYLLQMAQLEARTLSGSEREAGGRRHPGGGM